MPMRKRRFYVAAFGKLFLADHSVTLNVCKRFVKQCIRLLFHCHFYHFDVRDARVCERPHAVAVGFESRNVVVKKVSFCAEKHHLVINAFGVFVKARNAARAAVPHNAVFALAKTGVAAFSARKRIRKARKVGAF